MRAIFRIRTLVRGEFGHPGLEVQHISVLGDLRGPLPLLQAQNLIHQLQPVARVRRVESEAGDVTNFQDRRIDLKTCQQARYRP